MPFAIRRAVMPPAEPPGHGERQRFDQALRLHVDQHAERPPLNALRLA